MLGEGLLAVVWLSPKRRLLVLQCLVLLKPDRIKMPLRQPGKSQVCWYLRGIKVRFPHLTCWTLSDFLHRVLLQLNFPCPWWEKVGKASSEQIYTSGGFKEFLPVFIRSFSTCFELPSNNKAPSSAAWFNGESYCISILLLQSGNEAKFSVKGEVYLGE